MHHEIIAMTMFYIVMQVLRFWTKHGRRQYSDGLFHRSMIHLICDYVDMSKTTDFSSKRSF